MSADSEHDHEKVVELADENKRLHEEAERLYLEAEELLDQEIDIVETARLAKEALALFTELSNNVRVADTLRILCHCLRYEDKRKEAAALAKEHLRIFQAQGDRVGEAKMLISLAEVNYDKRGAKNREMAIEYAKKARGIVRQGGDRRLEAIALIALVNAELKALERKGFSRELAQEPLEHAALAVELAADARDKKLQACAFHALSVGRFLCKDWYLMFKSAQEALEIYQSLGLKKCEAYEMQCMAGWNLEAGHPQKALSLVRKAAAIFKELGVASAWEVSSLVTCAEALVQQKQVQEAKKLAHEARVRFRREGDRQAEAQMAEALVLAQLAAENWEEALVTAEETIALYRKLRDKQGEGDMLLTVARIQVKQERFYRATQATQRSLAIFQGGDNAKQQAAAFEILTDIHLTQEKHDEALQFSNEERNVLRAKGDMKGEAVALLHIANAHIQKGETDEAVALAQEATDLLQEVGDSEHLVHALETLAELLFEREDYEKSLREAVKCKVLLRELQESKQEVLMALTISRTYVHLMTKAKRVTAETRERALRAVQEAITLCGRHEAPPSSLTASALSLASQVYLIVGRVVDAASTADEAVSLLHDLQDDASEGYTLIISAQAHLQTGNMPKTREKLTRALACFERANDDHGESVARSWQESVEQMLRASSPTRDETGASEFAVPAHEEQVSQHRGTASFKPTLDVELVRSKVSQIVSKIIGSEDIHDDVPLMNAGLTSMSSMMLRDALARDFPESSLPFTLVFDYPSITSVAEYLVQSTRMLD